MSIQMKKKLRKNLYKTKAFRKTSAFKLTFQCIIFKFIKIIHSFATSTHFEKNKREKKYKLQLNVDHMLIQIKGTSNQHIFGIS